MTLYSRLDTLYRSTERVISQDVLKIITATAKPAEDETACPMFLEILRDNVSALTADMNALPKKALFTTTWLNKWANARTAKHTLPPPKGPSAKRTRMAEDVDDVEDIPKPAASERPSGFPAGPPPAPVPPHTGPPAFPAGPPPAFVPPHTGPRAFPAGPPPAPVPPHTKPTAARAGPPPAAAGATTAIVPAAAPKPADAGFLAACDNLYEWKKPLTPQECASMQYFSGMAKKAVISLMTEKDDFYTPTYRKVWILFYSKSPTPPAAARMVDNVIVASSMTRFESRPAGLSDAVISVPYQEGDTSDDTRTPTYWYLHMTETPFDPAGVDLFVHTFNKCIPLVQLTALFSKVLKTPVSLRVKG